jgi:hypothetical protein
MKESHKEPYGYVIQSGYKGWVEELGSYILFSTEKEYLEYIGGKED